MNEYKNYMDKITATPALHEKINQRLAHRMSNVDGATRKPAHLTYRFMGLAACLVILLGVIFIIPNLMQNEAPYISPGDTGQNGHFVQAPNINDPNAPISPAPIFPVPVTTAPQQNESPPPMEIHALTFNEVESVMSASMIIPDGYFDYDLTADQIRAVFPGVDMQMWGVVQYRADGSVWYVAAYEQMRLNFTSITLGYAGVMPDSTLLFPRDNPIVSDVHGVKVTAFVYGMDEEFFRADFVLDGIAYRVETSDLEYLWGEGNDERNGMERLTALVNQIVTGEATDLSVLADPAIPKLRNDQLTITQAREDADFGSFLPQYIPPGFVENSAHRLITTRLNDLFAYWGTDWGGGMHIITWRVSIPTAHDLQNIVSIHDRERFDVNLYEIPWADTVPDAYFNYFQSPVFLAEEFTPEAIQARTRWNNARYSDVQRGILPRWETSQFGVLFDDVIIVVSMTGVAPEDIWAMFESVPQINLR
ncbi:MAG: hypothetical protein FWC71_06395 [Defluviitaleaceae bacterium]|nr:hypothetical protein [Defluviitaleaceae bacterium]